MRLHSHTRQQIKTLTLARVSQKEIGQRLGFSRGSVYRAQKRLGLHASQGATPEQEEEILRLLRSGAGCSKIGRQLGVGEHQCRLIKKKYEIRRKLGERGYRHPLSASKRAKILGDIKLRIASAVVLAERHHVGHKLILKLAHQIFGAARFLPSAKWPLRSYFPQKPFG
jgi:DNA-binding CsgD family transcriptional regulator